MGGYWDFSTLSYVIMAVMKGQIDLSEDDFWTERLPFFTAQLPSYYRKPQQVHGRFHISEEEYSPSRHEIIPLSERRGQRTHILMQPYVLQPELTFTVGLFNKPKKYADQESPIGQVIGAPQTQGFREVEVGNAQAWYYPADKTIVLWECFFYDDFRRHPFAEDANMRNLWKGFEHWLLKQYPDTATIATTTRDPIAETVKEYQTFLKSLGYSPLFKTAFGKKVR
jgi:hypothetical protein